MGDAVVKPAEADAPAQSFPERLLGVFISPGETFADVVRKPDFILPLLLVILFMVAGTQVFLYKIGWEPVLRYGMEHSSRTSSMSPEQMQEMIGKMIPYYTWMARVTGFIWPPLAVLVGAVVGLVAVNSIFGGKITFKTAFSISSYAYLVNIIYCLIGMAMNLFGDPDHFISNPANATPTSVGFFLNPADTSKPLLSLAGSFEIFTLWNLALLAIGFSAASGRKVKVGTMFFTLFGVWMVKVLITMGLATLG